MPKKGKKIQLKLERRLTGYADLVKSSKSGGREYTAPGSRNPKKQG